MSMDGDRVVSGLDRIVEQLRQLNNNKQQKFCSTECCRAAREAIEFEHVMHCRECCMVSLEYRSDSSTFHYCSVRKKEVDPESVCLVNKARIAVLEMNLGIHGK